MTGCYQKEVGGSIYCVTEVATTPPAEATEHHQPQGPKEHDENKNHHRGKEIYWHKWPKEHGGKDVHNHPWKHGGSKEDEWEDCDEEEEEWTKWEEEDDEDCDEDEDIEEEEEEDEEDEDCDEDEWDGKSKNKWKKEVTSNEKQQ